MKISNCLAVIFSFVFVISCNKSDDSYTNGVETQHLENRTIVDADSIKGIIFHTEYEYKNGGRIHSMRDMIPFKTFEVWDPQINDIIRLEQALFKYWANEEAESGKEILSHFFETWQNLPRSNGRQYVGYKNQVGEKFIWAVVFKIIDDPLEKWEKHIIEPTGIAPVLIEVHFNVKENEIVHVGGY